MRHWARCSTVRTCRTRQAVSLAVPATTATLLTTLVTAMIRPCNSQHRHRLHRPHQDCPRFQPGQLRQVRY